ncbi:MAG: PEP-CTERM sorting domain-containing protein, partial [Coraliomargarita sp.]
GLGGNFSGSGFGLRFGTGAEGEEFVFALDTTTFGDISLTFDAQTNNGSSDLQFAYSANGGASYTNFGSAVTVGSSSALQTVDMSAADAIEGISQALIKVSISGLSGAETLSLDNVQVLSAGSAVPEPSSFAAIFGGLALAFAAARRRK